MANLRLEYLDPSQLADNPQNWRAHPSEQTEALKAAIDEVGWAGALLYNEQTQRLIDGHARKEIKAGEKVPVLIGSWTEDEEKKILATLDPLAAMAEANAEALAELLNEIETNSPALAEMMEALARENGINNNLGCVEDETPEPPKNPITQAGDLWLLGKHRLLCGDCRDAKQVETICDGAKQNVAITSPPYASQRDYDESSGFKPIHPDKYVEWWQPVQANIKRRLAADGSFFLNIKPHCEDGERVLYVLDLVLAMRRQFGWRYVDEFCWKHEGIPGQWANRLKNQWEPVFHFCLSPRIKLRHDSIKHYSDRAGTSIGAVQTTSQGNRGYNGQAIEGLALPGNVLSINYGCGRDDSAKHPAKYPVGLPAFFIRAFTDELDTVFDPFLGSGTTLIAAEQLNRRCYGIEISPAYCDVIIERWENLTGEKATKQP